MLFRENKSKLSHYIKQNKLHFEKVPIFLEKIREEFLLDDENVKEFLKKEAAQFALEHGLDTYARIMTAGFGTQFFIVVKPTEDAPAWMDIEAKKVFVNFAYPQAFLERFAKTLINHELAHIKFTHLTNKDKEKLRQNNLWKLLNLFEDRRIEVEWSREYPQTGDLFTSLHKVFFRILIKEIKEKQEEKEEISVFYLLYPLSFTSNKIYQGIGTDVLNIVNKLNIKGLPAPIKTPARYERFLKSCEKHFRAVIKCNSTSEVIDLVLNFMEENRDIFPLEQFSYMFNPLVGDQGLGPESSGTQSTESNDSDDMSENSAEAKEIIPISKEDLERVLRGGEEQEGRDYENKEKLRRRTASIVEKGIFLGRRVQKVPLYFWLCRTELENPDLDTIKKAIRLGRKYANRFSSFLSRLLSRLVTETTQTQTCYEQTGGRFDVRKFIRDYSQRGEIKPFIRKIPQRNIVKADFILDTSGSMNTIVSDNPLIPENDLNAFEMGIMFWSALQELQKMMPSFLNFRFFLTSYQKDTAYIAQVYDVRDLLRLNVKLLYEYEGFCAYSLIRDTAPLVFIISDGNFTDRRDLTFAKELSRQTNTVGVYVGPKEVFNDVKNNLAFFRYQALGTNFEEFINNFGKLVKQIGQIRKGLAAGM